jgi:hypothetical protein
MGLLASRSLTLVLTAATLLRIWPNSLFLLLAVIPPIILIWFPEQVDEFTFGLWDRGNRIDSHTPPLMISIFGWVILLLEASIVFYPRWLPNLLYGA